MFMDFSTTGQELQQAAVLLDADTLETSSPWSISESDRYKRFKHAINLRMFSLFGFKATGLTASSLKTIQTIHGTPQSISGR